MGEIIHNKLVRDKIPMIIKADSANPVTRTLSDDEYRVELLKKLIEEATELLESKGSLGERIDVEEVLRAIDSAFGLSTADIESARQEKERQRGGFTEKIYLEKVIDNN